MSWHYDCGPMCCWIFSSNQWLFTEQLMVTIYLHPQCLKCAARRSSNTSSTHCSPVYRSQFILWFHCFLLKETVCLPKRLLWELGPALVWTVLIFRTWQLLPKLPKQTAASVKIFKCYFDFYLKCYFNYYCIILISLFGIFIRISLFRHLNSFPFLTHKFHLY